MQDICGTVGDVTQEMGAIMVNSPSAQLSGALVNYVGNYVGNEIKTFGVEAGDFIKATGMYAENDIKRTTSIYGAAAKSIVRDENVRGTCTEGINFSGTLGIFTIDGSIGLSSDLKDNIAVQATGAWGVTASSNPSASLSLFKTVTNASDVNALEKEGGCIGGSIAAPVYGIPAYAGIDFVIVGDLDNKLSENGYGVTTALGVGVPGAEFHAEQSYTYTIKQFNFMNWMFGNRESASNCSE